MKDQLSSSDKAQQVAATPAQTQAQATSSQSHDAQDQSAGAVLGRMTILDTYPKYREQMVRLAQESRTDGERYRKQSGVTGWVVDKTESVSETVGEWYAWMRGSKQVQHPDPHVEFPPATIWDSVDQAIAKADLAYAAKDPVLLRQRVNDV